MTSGAPAKAEIPTKQDGTPLKGEGVSVDRISPHNVTVQWVTGCARRTFTLDDLTATVEQLEMLAELGGDVWLESRDSNGAEFAAILTGGRVYADSAVHSRFDPSAPSGEDGRMYHVSWAALKKALDARRKPPKAPESS